MQSVDFLQTLEFVDPNQIGIAGLSTGGHRSLFAALFEPQTSAKVSKDCLSGMQDFRETKELPNLWNASTLKSHFEASVCPDSAFLCS